MVRNRDTKIAQYEKNIEEGNSAINDLRQQLEKRLAEISEWKAEDERDNAQIAELIKNIHEQNETIRKWEEENARDDARIAELEKLVEEKDAVIAKLKEFIFNFRSVFMDVRNSAVSLEIVDETLIQQKVSSITSEITQSEQYKSLELTVTQRDEEINRLREENNRLREEVNKAYQARSETVLQLQNLQAELETQKNLVANFNLRITEYESTISSYSKRVEAETTTTIVAHSRVDNFKSSVHTATDQVEAMFKEIETILA